VEAIAAPPGKPIYVMTREETSFDDASGQAGYIIYLATVAHTTDGWRVTRWRPVT
jgi:hypothetical protein